MGWLGAAEASLSEGSLSVLDVSDYLAGRLSEKDRDLFLDYMTGQVEAMAKAGDQAKGFLALVAGETPLPPEKLMAEFPDLAGSLEALKKKGRLTAATRPGTFPVRDYVETLRRTTPITLERITSFTGRSLAGTQGLAVLLLQDLVQRLERDLQTVRLILLQA
jgi:hypothetical protein